MRALVVLSLALTAALGAEPDVDPKVAAAREAYLEGTALIKKAQWSDALAAFERSEQLYPHSSTTFSIGSCQRALGRYTLARSTLERALKESQERGGQLPQTLIADARSFISEIDRTLVHLRLQVSPVETEIAVDGRPLAAGESLLVLDPGAHGFLLSRKGYAKIVVHRSYAPGEDTRLELALERLPATLHITASQPGAIVTIDDRDVGPAPADILRPAGEYRVRVDKKGFAGYRARVRVQPGEETTLQATLNLEKIPLYKRWWFWTTVVAVVATGATLTWVFTRPPPAYDTGNTNWLVLPSH